MASPHVSGAGSLYLSRNTTVSAATADDTEGQRPVAGTVSEDGWVIKIAYEGKD